MVIYVNCKSYQFEYSVNLSLCVSVIEFSLDD